MNVARAIGSYITTQLGIPAFADESVHKGETFPCVEVRVLDGATSPAGCGRRSYYRKDGAAYTHEVKKYRAEDTVQINILAKATTDGSSESQCVNIANQVYALMLTAKQAKVHFEDPVTSEDLSVFSMKIGRLTGAIHNSQREPQTHEATMQIVLNRRVNVLTAVDRVMNPVTVNYGG